MVTFAEGFPDPEPLASIFLTTSIPSTTAHSPKRFILCMCMCMTPQTGWQHSVSQSHHVGLLHVLQVCCVHRLRAVRRRKLNSILHNMYKIAQHGHSCCETGSQSKSGSEWPPLDCSTLHGSCTVVRSSYNDALGTVPFPKTTWRPSSHGVTTVVMKNWLPFVLGPAFAMER